jgi:hypothetical protein
MPQQLDSIAWTSAPGIARNRASVASNVPKAFWWQWPWTRIARARAAAPWQLRAAGRELPREVFIREHRELRQAPGARIAGQQRRVLVAKGEEARGLEAHDRRPRLQVRRECLERAERLHARLVDHAGGEIGAPAAQRAVSGHGNDDLAARGGEHLVGRGQVSGLEPVVERVREKNHARALPVHRRRARSPCARELRQGASPVEAGHAFQQRARARQRLRDAQQRLQRRHPPRIPRQVARRGDRGA